MNHKIRSISNQSELYMTKQIKIMMDTGVVHDAIRSKLNEIFFKKNISQMASTEQQHRIDDAGAFWKLINIKIIDFYYNFLLENHIERTFSSVLEKKEWLKIKERCSKAAIPLIRADGIVKANGSSLAGGEYGGTLRSLLHSNHEKNIKKAASHINDDNYKDLRYKEHDYEHLESALELKADYFITVDYKLLRRLQSLTSAQKKDPAIARAGQIAIRPLELLTSIKPNLSETT